MKNLIIKLYFETKKPSLKPGHVKFEGRNYKDYSFWWLWFFVIIIFKHDATDYLEDF